MDTTFLDFLQKFREDKTFEDLEEIFGYKTANNNFNLAFTEGFIGEIKRGK